MKLLIASNNRHKIREIRQILGERFEEILSLSDAGIDHETVEDGKTFYENARKKAAEIAAISGLPTLADDSGLCVDALGGAPGVYSARFAGEHGDTEANNALLLEKLRDVSDRRAHFLCTTVLIFPDGREISAEGRIDGVILGEHRGQGGFGYDPLFLPEGGCQTLAELSEEEKNAISHRRRALEALLAKL